MSSYSQFCPGCGERFEFCKCTHKPRGRGEKELIDAVLPPYKSTIDNQVDGDHYKKLTIQPAVYSFKNFGPAWHQGEIIKYVTRYKDKNGRVDLEKARHLIDMLIELEYENGI